MGSAEWQRTVQENIDAALILANDWRMFIILDKNK